MWTQHIPAGYAGKPDPGDENTGRHATRPQTYQTAKASVCRFGTRWHWKCGDGQCLGGSKRTRQEAHDAAEAHIREDHVRETRVHDGANCWCEED